MAGPVFRRAFADTAPCMGRYTRSFTDEMRAAVASAKLDHGLSIPTILGLAKAGKLNGCGPFEMGATTARDAVTAEKQRRERDKLATNEGLGDLVEDLQREIMLGLRAEVDVLLSTKPLDLERIRAVARILRDHTRRAPTGKSQRPSDDHDIESDAEPEKDTLEQIAETLAAPPSRTTPAHQKRTEPTPTPAETPANQPTRNTADADFLSRAGG